MKNAKMISWLLIMVLLLCSMAFPAAAEEEMKLISIVAIEGETVWIRTSQGLAPFDKDGWQMDKALYPGADAHAIGPDGHIYYTLNGDVFEFDRDGNEIDKWETPMERFTKMLVNEKYIMLMNASEYAVIDTDTRTMTAGAAENLFDISLYDEESFVIAQSGIAMIYTRLDCKTLDVIEESYIHAIHNGIAYCSAEEGLYLFIGEQIQQIDFPGRESKVYKTITGAQQIWDIQMNADMIAVIADNALQVHSRKEEVVPTKTLTIHGANQWYDSKLKKAIEIFTQRHPEYKVEMSGDVVKKQVKLDLMSGAVKYDILFLAPDNTDYKFADMVMDLSQSEQIVENLGNYIDMPFLWENDGSLYGIPVIVHPLGFNVLPSLWEEIKETFPEEWTLEDLYSYADKAEELGVKLISTDYRWSALRQQYESEFCDLYAGVADYENDTFRSLVSLWKQMEDEKLVEYSQWGTGKELFAYCWMSVTDKMNDRRYVTIGMPLLDGKQVTPIEMTGFYVYKYSENAEAAMEFMEIYTSYDVQILAEGPNYTFLKDVELEEYPSYANWKRFEDITPTEEEWEKWQHYLSTGKLVERVPEYEEAVKELVMNMMMNKITEDEFVAEVQERADLMVGE